MLSRNKFTIYRLMIPALLFAGISSCKITDPYEQLPGIVDNKLYRDLSKTDTATIAAIPWRQIFTDTLLQSLIQEGIHSNLDLKIAVARMKQADANLKQSQLAFLPGLYLNASTTFQKQADAQPGQPRTHQMF